MSSQYVQSNAYYYVTSDQYGPSFYLSDYNHDGSLSLTNTIFSSNNWQIFYQDPIYLIRNYDHGAMYQLGIAEDSPTIPTLMTASGNLTQQWNLTLWEDGTYRLANVWLGTVQMLGVGERNDEVIPVMTASQNGSHWSFAINPSVLTSNLTADMLQSVSLQAAPSSISTLNTLSTSASTTTSSTPAKITMTTTTITAGTVPSASSSARSQLIKDRSLSGSAVAGIVVATIAAALVLFGLLFFVSRRRRQQRHGLLADHAPLAQQHERPLPTVIYEADNRHPQIEIGVSGSPFEIGLAHKSMLEIGVSDERGSCGVVPLRCLNS